jgi:hypothetical protein
VWPTGLPEVTLWNVTRRDGRGVWMHNPKLCNIRPSGTRRKVIYQKRIWNAILTADMKTWNLSLLLRRKQATTILLLLLRRELATTILLLHRVVQSCHHYNTRPKQRNRTLCTRRATHSRFKYPAKDFLITSCHGSIHLPVWSLDQPEVDNRLCQEICTQYPTYDDPNTGSHHVVLWRIPDVIRNRRWGGLSTRFTGSG